jgi:hypothetical protein
MGRVETGCRDCKRCTNSAIGEAGRKLGKATLAVSTAGVSVVAGAFTKNCRGCGHKLSLHSGVGGASADASVTVLNAAPAPTTVYVPLPPPAPYPPAPYPAAPREYLPPPPIALPAATPAAPLAVTAAPAQPTLVERMANLNSLRDAGMLTPQEYEDKRAEILRDV